jgi:hypothetical protein
MISLGASKRGVSPSSQFPPPPLKKEGDTGGGFLSGGQGEDFKIPLALPFVKGDVVSFFLTDISSFR